MLHSDDATTKNSDDVIIVLQSLQTYASVTLPEDVINVVTVFLIGWEKVATGPEWIEVAFIHTPYIKKKTDRQVAKQKERNVRRRCMKNKKRENVL